MDIAQPKEQAKAILLFPLLLCCLSILPSPSQSICIDDDKEAGEARWRNQQPPSSMASSGTPLFRPPRNTHPEAQKCWLHFQRIPGCGDQLIDSASSGNKLEVVSRQCCVAVLNLSPDCFYKVLFTNPFSPEFGPKAKYYCMQKLAK